MLFYAQNQELNVSMSITSYGEVVFSVNDSFNYRPNQHKIAITRWLLKTWEEAKQEVIIEKGVKTLTCTAHSGDGKGSYRRKIYQKVGFKPVLYINGDQVLSVPSGEMYFGESPNGLTERRLSSSPSTTSNSDWGYLDYTPCTRYSDRIEVTYEDELEGYSPAVSLGLRDLIVLDATPDTSEVVEGTTEMFSTTSTTSTASTASRQSAILNPVIGVIIGLSIMAGGLIFNIVNQPQTNQENREVITYGDF